MPGGKLVTGDSTILGDVHLVGRVLQVGHGDHRVVGRVLGHENAQGGERRLGTPAERRGLAADRSGPNLERYGEREGAPLPDGALDPDLPTHRLHQALRDGEPQP